MTEPLAELWQEMERLRRAIFKMNIAVREAEQTLDGLKRIWNAQRQTKIGSVGEESDR